LVHIPNVDEACEMHPFEVEALKVHTKIVLMAHYVAHQVTADAELKCKIN
jgi:hypothetical protein